MRWASACACDQRDLGAGGDDVALARAQGGDDAADARPRDDLARRLDGGDHRLDVVDRRAAHGEFGRDGGRGGEEG